MAYIDKITTMRRMALIYPSAGHIAYEGINIEGVCVVKEVSTDKVTTFKSSQAEGFAAKRELVVKYQDHEGQEHWEPRLS